MIGQEKLIEEISIRGNGILQSIRQSDNAKLHEGDLVFLYPMIIDATLDRKWGDTLRDFVSVVFTNRIKQANVLNVISDAVSPGTVKSGGREINPAQQLHQSLGGGEALPNPEMPNLFQNEIDSAKKYDYSETLTRLREYIKNQITNDPQYSNLRPIVSEVIAQNLIPIPIIIGTNKLKIDSNALYWILFIAGGQNMDMSTISSIDPIGRLLRQIPDNNYEKFMEGIVDSRAMDDPRKLSQMINNIQDGTDRALHRFRMVLDLKTWEEEMPALPNVAQLSTAVQNKRAAEQSLGNRASTSFKTFIANEIVGLLQSITHSIVPETEIDIGSKLSKFIENVSGQQGVSDSYKELYGLMTGTMVDASNSSPKGTDALDVLLQTATDMCKNNAEINVNKIFRENISPLKFGLTQGGKALAKFTEDIIRAGAQLSGLSKNIEQWISELGGQEALSLLSDNKKNIRQSVIDYFENGWGFVGDMTSITGTPVNRYGSTGDPNNTLFGSERFQHLTGGQGDQQAFEDNMYNTITEIIHFLYMFCFFSFFCDYLRELEAEVTVQKRDAVSFPNYILTFKIEYVNRIFWALSSRNFKNEITEEKEEAAEEDYKTKKTWDWKFWKGSRSDAKRLEEELDSKMEKFLSDADLNTYSRKTSINEKVDLIYGIFSQRFTDSQRKELDNIKDWIDSKNAPIRKSKRKGTDVQQFQVTSASNTIRQIDLMQKRLKIPNIIVIDEKNKKVYYKLMFMPRVLNLDFGSLNTYINNQKNILQAF